MQLVNRFGGTPRTLRINGDTLGNCLRSGETLKSSNTLFPELGNTTLTALFNPPGHIVAYLAGRQAIPVLLQQLWRACPRRFADGRAIEYDYTAGSGVTGTEIIRRVTTRRTYADANDGNTLVGTMSVGNFASGGSVEVKQLAPNGTVLSRELHFFYGDPVQYFVLKEPCLTSQFKVGT